MGKEKKISVRSAKKLSATDVKKLGNATRGSTQPCPPKAGAVEGQRQVWERVECPHCFGISYAWFDTDYYQWYTCCFCGGAFQAIGRG